MSRRNLEFSSVRTEGGLLPQDVLSRIQTGDKDLPGLTPESYHLGPHERIGEAVNRTWSRMISAWRSFQEALAKEPKTSEATGLTRDRWLLPLFQELGYGRLPKGQAIEVDGKRYAVSHAWHLSPIHLLGAGVDLDRRQAGVSGAAKASPHGLVQEFLNRSEHHAWGFVSNGVHLRILRDHHSLTRQAYIEFDLQSIMDGEQYSEFMLLWMVCHQSRVEAEKPNDCWLERWFNTSRDEGIRALDKLRVGVEKAIESLGTGFLAHRTNAKLRDALASGELNKQEYYRQVLRLVYRLIFLFVAEERGALLDPQAEDSAKNRYLRFYAARRLRALSNKRRGGAHFDLWQGLRFVMSHLDNGCRELALPALGSLLWAPDACPWLMDAECSNEHLLDAVRHISNIEEGRTRYAVNWRNVGADELGSIYESLLELHPRLNKEAATFVLETAAGHERKTTGSYYTPTELVDCLLNSALDPLLDQACKRPDPESAILDLKVCDPACGSGHFLVAAARRISKRLAAVRAGEDEPSPREVQHALRDVVGRCIYGVDVNPMAVELCKVSLWMEAIEPGRPLSFLDSHIQCGNALLGATSVLMNRGIPDDAFNAIEGDDVEVAKQLKAQNERESRAVAHGQETMFAAFESTASKDAFAVAERASAIDGASDADITALRVKAGDWEKLTRSLEFKDAWFRADAWCAAFVWPKSPGESAHAAITADTWHHLTNDASVVAGATRKIVREIASHHRFFHWHLAFPHVFGARDAKERNAGFDCVLGNPPWERIQVEEKEFFSKSAPELAEKSGRARKQAIEALPESNPALYQSWAVHKRTLEAVDQFIKFSGRYPASGKGKLTTQACFVELASSVLARSRPITRAGLVVPLGVATDKASGDLFFGLISQGRLISLVGFENEEFVFPAVHHSYKFCLLTIAGREGSATAMAATFSCRSVAEARVREMINISPDDVEALNPESKTCPVLGNASFFKMAQQVYRKWAPIEGTSSPGPWSLRIHRLFNASDDVHLFTQVNPSAHHCRRLIRDDLRLLPVFEAKMFHQFDHRFGTYIDQTAAQARQGKLPELDDDAHQDPILLNQSRYWVDESLAEEKLGRHSDTPWVVAVRDVTSAVVYRTAIACVMPRVASVNTLWHLSFGEQVTAKDIACFVAVFNSVLFDFLARQKVTGIHLSPYMIAQLPCPPPTAFGDKIPWSDESWRDWLSARAGELSCTSWDLEPFAAACGLESPCYRWDSERRHFLRAELDAALLHMAGASYEQAEALLDTFRVLREDEEKRLGSFQTKIAVLDVYRAMQRAIEAGEQYLTALDPPPAHPSVSHPETTRPAWASRSSMDVGAVPSSVIPVLDAAQAAAVYVWAVLHAIGGSITRIELARAFVLRNRPDLLLRFAPAEIQAAAHAWASRVTDRTVNAGILADTVASLAQRDGIKLTSSASGQSVIATSAHTPTEDQIDEWFRFEARLALRVLHSLPATHAQNLDEVIADAERVVLQAGGVT